MIHHVNSPGSNLRLDPLDELKHEYECIQNEEGNKVVVHATITPTSTAFFSSPQSSRDEEEKETDCPLNTIVVIVHLTAGDDIEGLDENDGLMDQQQPRGPVPIMRVSSYLPKHRGSICSKSTLDEDDDDDNKSRRSISSRVSFAEDVVSTVHTTPRYKREDVPDLFYSRKDIKMFKHAFRCGLICAEEMSYQKEEEEAPGDYCISCY
jgi:hypothetical protein